MSREGLPRRRWRDHSCRAERLLVRLEPADRHARLLGVLGHVERRRDATPVRTSGAKDHGGDWADFRRVARIALPLADPAHLESIASAATHVRVAAA